MKRRDFLRVLGVLSGSTLLSACGSKTSKTFVSPILPPGEGIVPGVAYYFPSTCTECPAGCGLSVKMREGWPIKLEGARRPGHPAVRDELRVGAQHDGERRGRSIQPDRRPDLHDHPGAADVPHHG